MRFKSFRAWTTSSKLPRLFALSTCKFPKNRNRQRTNVETWESNPFEMLAEIIIQEIQSDRYLDQSGFPAWAIINCNPTNSTSTRNKIRKLSAPEASNFQESKQNPILLDKNREPFKPRNEKEPKSKTREEDSITLEGWLTTRASETRRQQQEKETNNPFVGSKAEKRITIWAFG